MARTAPARTRGRSWRAALGTVAAAVTVAAGVTIALPDSADAATTLKQLADARGKDVGFALDPNRLGEAQYKAIADSEFNLVVAENAMKWANTEPTRGQFDFGQGDQVASYAAQQGKTLYGHTLVWHSQLAPWVEQIQSGTDLLAAMRNHVTQVATHYRGQVAEWDVVNEAFEENGSRRQSIFQQRIGNSYIEEAFRAARAADPTAKLCINDYNTDGVNAKSTAILNLVTDFKSRGVPIDCVGFQAHLIVNQVPGDIQQNLQRFINAGVTVRITELDIRMNTPATATNLQAQRNNYRQVFAACLALAGCEGVTVWGITDRYSWVPDVFPGQGAALMWDDNYNKKPAYDGATEGLGGTVDPTTSPSTPDTSPSTPNTSPSTQAPPGGCRVTYQNNSWNNGFTTNVIVRNNGATAINGWTLTWSFANGQVVTNAWNATVTQSGAAATARNVGYNPTIPANGGSQSFGFQGTHSGTNNAPTAFSLNGTACTVG